MLYAPFELHCKWRKVAQMSMHGEVQGQLKSEFNDKLRATVNHKRAELERLLQEHWSAIDLETPDRKSVM